MSLHAATSLTTPPPHEIGNNDNIHTMLMTQHPHPALQATAHDVDLFDEHSNRDNNNDHTNGDDDHGCIHCPLPHSKCKMEGAVIFSTN